MQMISFCWPQIERMVNVCQSYAEQNNPIFSTDPTPALSKPKCILFCGRSGKVQYPAPVQLNGQDLPWVESTVHLGHTSLLTWKRIVPGPGLSLLIEVFSSGKTLILQSLTKSFKQSESSNMMPMAACSEQFFKFWNTAVKLLYEVPRSTLTFLVEGHLLVM